MISKNHIIVFKQTFKFGIVGVIAAVVHFIIVTLLVYLFSWYPLLANIIAFLIAYQISYFGHKNWTFKQEGKIFTRSSNIKFFIVASLSFILNEGLYAVYLTFIPSYQLALFLTLATVPPITFLLSKLWAFR
ncbi:GtrA family protein [Thiotrichales bacterium 19S9-12]|nr:GtrA family protein [Thiotrichales bacterium 19S9-11]MCF6812360.1 GtrA family protein [Thiotrichales bacterium 19S9-12]